MADFEFSARSTRPDTNWPTDPSGMPGQLNYSAIATARSRLVAKQVIETISKQGCAAASSARGVKQESTAARSTPRSIGARCQRDKVNSTGRKEALADSSWTDHESHAGQGQLTVVNDFSEEQPDPDRCDGARRDCHASTNGPRPAAKRFPVRQHDRSVAHDHEYQRILNEVLALDRIEVGRAEARYLSASPRNSRTVDHI